jgi:hypothetical protein
VEAELKVGRSGQYEVQVDGRSVAEKTIIRGFPTDEEVVRAVAQALG